MLKSHSRNSSGIVKIIHIVFMIPLYLILNLSLFIENFTFLSRMKYMKIRKISDLIAYNDLTINLFALMSWLIFAMFFIIIKLIILW